MPVIGDVREDGYVFKGMKRSSKNGKLYENWLSPATIAKAATYHKRSAERRRQRRLDDDEFRAADNLKITARQRSWMASDPRRLMLQSARHRAKKAGVPCLLSVDDFSIPELCPVLGIRLQRSPGKRGGMSPFSPSLDRVKPELGYVPGNVIVVSMRANFLKNNASPEELQLVAKFYSALTSQSTARPRHPPESATR